MVGGPGDLNEVETDVMTKKMCGIVKTSVNKFNIVFDCDVIHFKMPLTE